jgi:FtsH-binding integral membrane protein
MALVPLCAALVVAPLLALAADRAGRTARLATRVLLALPLALYAPSAVAVGWFLDRLREDGAPSFGSRSAVVSVYAWLSFGLVVAIAATAFLAVLRGRSPQRRPGAALLVVGGVLGLGVLAVALQAVTVPLLLATRPAPPVASAVLRSLQLAQIGPGAAASVILLVLLAVLGIAAVALLLATRTRIEAGPPTPARPGHPLAAVAVAAGGVVLLAVVGYGLFP